MTDDERQKLLEHLRERRVSVEKLHELDEFLLLSPDKGKCASKLVSAAAGERLVTDPPDGGCWDVVSTGCAGDLTELIGHLWLRVQKRKTDLLMVPKIAARRGSVGFSDVLESGAYPLAARRSDFQHEIKECGISVARGDAMFAPVGAELRRRSREIGADRNAAVTCLEILSDLTAAGVTKAIVDVKCGFNTKMRGSQLEYGNLVKVESGLHCKGADKFRILSSLLEDIGLRKSTSRQFENAVLTVADGELPDVSWCLTNADVPQSRAIGRTLALLHLKGLLTGSYGKTKDGNGLSEHLFWKNRTMNETEYAQFYVVFLGTLCGINEPKKAHESMKGEWGEFEKELPFLKSDDIAREVPEWMAGFRPGVTIRWNPMDVNDELEVCSIGAYPYCVGPNGLIATGQKVESIKAYRLERFFAWLCREDPEDPSVGIWLHTLPGEEWTENKPLVSVFYRPQRTPKRSVLERLRHFVRVGIKWAEK